MKRTLKAVLLSTAILPGLPLATDAQQAETIFSYVSEWWNGGTGTGKWFGLKPVVEDYGLNVYGRWHGTYYGNVNGGLKRAGAFDESLHILGDLDCAKLVGWEGLKILLCAFQP